MTLSVRAMVLGETEFVIDYFLGATPEHLELMGVDPTRLPDRIAWRERLARDFALPVETRPGFLTIWLDSDKPIGFSSVSHLKFGEQAHMHLHIVDPARRAGSTGTACVRKSVAIYFETLKLKRLFSEPNAFNTAPNRTLQKAGFRYVKTYWTVPGWINYHQPVTRWVYEP
jgi:RimJ/RimL family protein N-acetyltransferase